MKKFMLVPFAVFAVLISSCSTVKLVGSVNMISTRNIESNIKYELISTYVGGTEKERKKSRCETIDEAMNSTVRKVPGGEYMMNVKIYRVNSTYFAVEGDVWGIPGKNTYRGLTIGDKVTWKKMGTFYTGSITALKDDKYCYVKTDNTNQTVELLYDDITKTAATTSSNTSTGATGQKYNIGDKVKFPGTYGTVTEGVIIKMGSSYATIEYARPNGQLMRRGIKYSQLSK